jgi:23S rRNA U2552 (ribose-2'-O)-methylase RlmE/FtsJ
MGVVPDAFIHVDWTTQLNRGLIGFDLGRQFQEKRVEKPASSRKRSPETYKCQRKAH